jgi:hypothetical protein
VFLGFHLDYFDFFVALVLCVVFFLTIQLLMCVPLRRTQLSCPVHGLTGRISSPLHPCPVSDNG